MIVPASRWLKCLDGVIVVTSSAGPTLSRLCYLQVPFKLLRWSDFAPLLDATASHKYNLLHLIPLSRIQSALHGIPPVSNFMGC